MCWFDLRSMAVIPIGLDGATYRVVDLEDKGLPGLLSEQGG